MSHIPYTLADLERARASLAAVRESNADYAGNNPHKYDSELKAARREVRRVEAALKESGVIPLSEQEQLERELDKAFPQARSKEIVEYQGKRYRRWFLPAEVSNSGKTVKAWDKGWKEEMDGK